MYRFALISLTTTSPSLFVQGDCQSQNHGCGVLAGTDICGGTGCCCHYASGEGFNRDTCDDITDTSIGCQACWGNEACYSCNNCWIEDGACQGDYACYSAANVRIGRDACRSDERSDQNVCRDMGDGNDSEYTTFIGDFACHGGSACKRLKRSDIGQSSCQSDSSCVDNRNSVVGSDSCTGVSSCNGMIQSTIGVNSCRGDRSCFNAEFMNIGNDSCNDGTSSCDSAYIAAIHDFSCKGERACYGLSEGGSIGTSSCSGSYSCYQSGGEEDFGSLTVGQFSCQQDDACSHAYSTAIQDGSCLVKSACTYVDYSVIGSRSCNSNNACRDTSNVVIGDDCCNANDYVCSQCESGSNVPPGACSTVDGVDITDGKCNYCHTDLIKLDINASSREVIDDDDDDDDDDDESCSQVAQLFEENMHQIVAQYEPYRETIHNGIRGCGDGKPPPASQGFVTDNDVKCHLKVSIQMRLRLKHANEMPFVDYIQQQLAADDTWSNYVVAVEESICDDVQITKTSKKKSAGSHSSSTKAVKSRKGAGKTKGGHHEGKKKAGHR